MLFSDKKGKYGLRAQEDTFMLSGRRLTMGETKQSFVVSGVRRGVSVNLDFDGEEGTALALLLRPDQPHDEERTSDEQRKQ